MEDMHFCKYRVLERSPIFLKVERSISWKFLIRTELAVRFFKIMNLRTNFFKDCREVYIFSPITIFCFFPIYFWVNFYSNFMSTVTPKKKLIRVSKSIDNTATQAVTSYVFFAVNEFHYSRPIIRNLVRLQRRKLRISSWSIMQCSLGEWKSPIVLLMLLYSWFLISNHNIPLLCFKD